MSKNSGRYDCGSAVCGVGSFREKGEAPLDGELPSSSRHTTAEPLNLCMDEGGGPSSGGFWSLSSSLSTRVPRRDAATSDSGHQVKDRRLPTEPTSGSVSKEPCGQLEDACRQVPGATASTVEVGQLWNSSLRWMLQGPRCRLRSFLHSSFQKRVREVNIPRTSGSVWPMPLPYRRVDNCAKEEVSLRRFVNTATLVMNWLQLGSPSRCPLDFSLHADLSGEQRGVVARLRRLVQAWHTAEPVAAADMGRSAGKVEKLEGMISSLTTAAAELLSSTGSGKLSKTRAAGTQLPSSSDTVAKDIEAHRLQFTGRPSFEPDEWLTEPAKTWYQKPLSCSLPPEESFEVPPTVQVKGRRSEVLQLLHALDRSGRLNIFPAAAVRMTHRSGMFALLKNLSTDRLILDSRPANLLEAPLNEYTQTMASPLPLLDMVLRPDHVIRSSGEDLKDFYYFFRISSERSVRNAIAMTLSSAEAASFGCFEKSPKSADGRYVPALNSMAMGDLNSVEYGQQSHFRLAQHLGLHVRDFMTLRSRFPRQDWAVGVVIDDLVIVEQLPSQQETALVASSIADSMVQLYEKVGLRPNTGKRFRNELQAKFWGMLLDGESGLVQAQIEKALPLAMLTAQVARLGWSSRKLLEMLAGAWTATIQFRKRCMCLLDTVFEDIQRFDYGVTFQISTTTVEELWSLAVLAPLFVTDLRADVDPELSLVDASDGWEAEVNTVLPSPLAYELARQKLNKAAWSRLLSPLQELNRIHGRSSPEEEIPDGEEAVRQHPLWRDTIRSSHFSLVRRKRIRRRTHINHSELSAALDAGMRRSRAHPSSRVLLGSDSQVVLGALVRGRSSSSSLNARLRKFLPTILGFNTYLRPQYVHTLDNVADDPTRDRLCREPSHPLPQWAEDVCKGDYVKCDDELASAGVDDASIARLPVVKALPTPAIAPLSLRKQLRARQWRTGFLGSGTGGRRSKPPVASFPVSPWLPKTALSSATEQLIRKLPRSQFVLPTGKSFEDVCHLQGHLDLFSGAKGFARALANTTGRWVLTYDLSHDVTEDLLDPHVQKTIASLVRGRAFLSITAGPVCSSFSRAVRPAVRSAAWPRGFEDLTANMAKKVAEGNAMSQWLASLVLLAIEFMLIWWVENPSGSYLWHQPEWLEIQQRLGVGFFSTDYCRWGTPYRKRTRFLGNLVCCPDALHCLCTRPHVKLVGYSRQHGCSWTLVAQPYPSSLCKFLALAVSESLKPISRRVKLDIAACAKHSGRGARIGEAQHPGPRLRRPEDPLLTDLEQVDTVKPATRLVQAKAVEKYSRWLGRNLTAAAVASLDSMPQLYVLFLRAFGNWMFQQGQAMYLFRHLVVYFQQLWPGERSLMAPAWDLLTRWEIAVPVNHRPPTPRILVDSFITMALHWGWKKWAGLTALAFYGGMRVGEPLKATRADLVLPRDSWVNSEVLFLKINAPKPGRRGRGRVQHSKVTEELIVQLVDKIFGLMEPSDRLYAGSPSTYRRRRDKLLEHFRIPKGVQLTPGGLRGGGATYMYHSGVPVQDVLWRLRLRHLQTLESYLQEVAADSALAKLPSDCRESLRVCAKFLPFTAQIL